MVCVFSLSLSHTHILALSLFLSLSYTSYLKRVATIWQCVYDRLGKLLQRRPKVHG